jgi:EAL domain-containing protein (putative c-di-GMP-specific phosphodiesterase class I)
LACRDLGHLDGLLPGRLGVNISPRQFRTGTFIEHVLACLCDHGTDPNQLQLEITESCAMADQDEAAAKMENLRARGLRFVIDDFGTGFSSLARLRRLPVAAIKIDRSFVRGVLSNPNDAIIVETIIVMARHLGLEVVAQGVESEATLTFLAERGCTKFQGYYFSRPVELEDLRRMLDAGPASEQPT